MHFHGGGTLDGAGGPSLRTKLKKNIFSKREIMLLEEKERKEGPLEKGWTENCCAIEVWISKETGELGEGGKIHETCSTFCVCRALHFVLSNALELASLHPLFH